VANYSKIVSFNYEGRYLLDEPLNIPKNLKSICPEIRIVQVEIMRMEEDWIMVSRN